MRILATFVPVEKEHNILYLRFYYIFLCLTIIEYRRKRAALQNEKPE
jgi:hypothetical protein